MRKSDRVEIPSPEEMESTLSNLRYKVDISQSDLAEELGISPSQLSKIENNCERAKYGDVYRILRKLREKALEGTEPISGWINRKHDRSDEKYELVYLRPDDSVREAKKKMSELGISQLPVIDEDGECIGMVRTEDLILESVRDEDLVEELDPLADIYEVSEHTHTSEVRRRFSTGVNDAVLVRADDPENGVEGTNYLGILTPSDFVEERS